MVKEPDDTTPNEESTEEQTPPAASSTADETTDQSEESETETTESEETADDDAGEGSTDGEESTQEDDEEQTIPVSRHKKILENARRGIIEDEETSGASSQKSTDENEEADLKLSPDAQKLIAKGVEETLAAKEAEAAKAERLRLYNDEVAALSKEHDGKDGLPKFDEQEVIKWGKANGVLNLRHAYRLMNADAHAKLERQRIATELAKNPPSSSDRPGSSEAGAAPDKRERVDMRDRSSITARIRKVRQKIEAGRG